jgi:hypothetical protein
LAQALLRTVTTGQQQTYSTNKNGDQQMKTAILLCVDPATRTGLQGQAVKRAWK